MSKASEWVENLSKRPKLKHIVEGKGCQANIPLHANVMDDGRCAVQQFEQTPICMEPEQAMALATWIIETFGASYE